MKILFCSGEVYPFSKTGGLADVASILPREIKHLGHEIYVITPLYQQSNSFLPNMKHLGSIDIKMGSLTKKADYYQYFYQNITYIFIRNDEYYDRPLLYTYEDDDKRFTFFNYAILESLPLLNYYPDIIHTNDWQTGLISYLLDTKYRQYNDQYKRIKTLLSIHNLEKQGSFDLSTESLFEVKNYTYMHNDRVNFLKAAIMRSSAINTVSETYKSEILTRFYGFALDGPLKSKQYQLFGILNGFDNRLYDPSLNKDLIKNYDLTSFNAGKKANKKALTEQLGFDDDLPLFAFIGRFSRQKGIDILVHSLDNYLKNNQLNFIAIGKGTANFENYFKELEKKFPSNVYFSNSYDQVLTQRFYAASDFYLLPSLFEPCGLNQMIAMRYGTLPIVRETGGLKDTVISYFKDQENGYGFSFENYDVEEFKQTMDQVLEIYKDKKQMDKIIRRAMSIEFSTTKMAEEYVNLYKLIIDDEI
ncbi:MAG: glycogen/starch synthase [Acholeplasmataceae bacterium]